MDKHQKLLRQNIRKQDFLSGFPLKIIIGCLLRKLGRKICGPYWVCDHCICIKYKEEEASCWECGLGEMIYQGDTKWTM